MINQPPNNAVGQEIANALHYSSDHLPVMASFTFTPVIPAGIADVKTSGPNDFKLFQNYPNPFNPSTTISYYLPKDGKVILKVYNILAQEIATVVNEIQAPGMHRVEFNASVLPGGVYMYRIEAGNFSQVRKMVLIK